LTYRKKGFITSGRDRARAFVSTLLISLKAFSCSFPILKVPFFPLCGFIEGFGQEGVVRDPDLAKTCGSQKLSDLLAGLGGWDGQTASFLSGQACIALGTGESQGI
jgi:hypothetical protein